MNGDPRSSETLDKTHEYLYVEPCLRQMEQNIDYFFKNVFKDVMIRFRMVLHCKVRQNYVILTYKALSLEVSLHRRILSPGAHLEKENPAVTSYLSRAVCPSCRKASFTTFTCSWSSLQNKFPSSPINPSADKSGLLPQAYWFCDITLTSSIFIYTILL